MRTLAFLLLAIFVLPLVTGLGKEDIVQLTSQYFKSNTHAYLWPEQVTTVKERYGHTYTFTQPIWFVWIDNEPGMQYGHNTTYLFIHNNTTIEVIHSPWPPESLEQAQLIHTGKQTIIQKLIKWFTSWL